MQKRLFGTLPSGEEVYVYTLASGKAVLEVITYGAAIRSFKPYGEVDIIGGFDSLDDYLADTSHQGATIGRVANRIGGAQFKMAGAIYMLPDHDGLLRNALTALSVLATIRQTERRASLPDFGAR